MSINTKKYIESYIKIRDKKGNVIPLKLNEPQLKYYNVVKKLYEEYSEKFNQTTIYYLCEYVSGEFGTGTGPEFSNDPKYIDSGKYLPEIVKREDIEKIPLMPPKIKEKFVEDIKNRKI